MPTDGRLASMDALRGFALLGILLLNINAFALPVGAYVNPSVWGGATGADLATWIVAMTWWDGKMRCLFSLLFGASACLLIGRAEERGAGVHAADLYYRRTLWLIAIGLLHAHFIWAGDILFGYGVVGLVLFPLRRLPARTLIAAASLILLLQAWQGVASGIGASELQAQAARARQSPAPAASELQARAQWAQLEQRLATPPADVHAEIAAHRGGWLDNFVRRSGEAALLEFRMFFEFFLLDVLGMLIMGMGLARAGVFDASRSYRFYAGLAAAGFLAGAPLNYWAATSWLQSGFDLPSYFWYVESTADIGRFAVALGYVGVVMIVCKAGLRTVTAPLAAVGRTALSNYLLTSVLCTFIFNGYGLGWFGALSRSRLLLVVPAVWVLNLAWSRWWLSRYHHGPAEWAWRSLTHWKVQPMRRTDTALAR